MIREPQKITVVALIGQLGRGGSERQLTLIMSHLDSRQFNRHVVVFNPSSYDVYDEQLRSAGVHVWAMPSECRSISRRMLYLFRLLRQLRADVVHSWTLNDNPYAGIVGWLSGVPVRWGALRGSLNLPGFHEMSSVFKWLSLHSVKCHVVNSKSLVEELAARGVARPRIFFSATLLSRLQTLERRLIFQTLEFPITIRSSD